jgi:hypothetical protein
MRLNRKQAVALHRKWEQSDQGMTYRQFRRTVTPAIGLPCAMVFWCGMWLGIEADGYTHA